MRQLLKKVRHFMKTVSPFLGGKHSLAKVTVAGCDTVGGLSQFGAIRKPEHRFGLYPHITCYVGRIKLEEEQH
ncbi:hypothetical protein JNE17039_45300 (plasmid) [Escherichia coli]